MIHVTVISPNQVIRSGLGAMLADGSPGLVISDAAEFSEVESWLDEIDVLVVASETALPDVERRLTNQQTGRPAVLFLTDQAEFAQILAKQKGRAWGALSLDCSTEELQAAVFALHQGLVVGSPGLFEKLFRGNIAAGDPQPGLVEALTQRETEVLGLLAFGLANKQIAVQLGISEHTVKFHISTIYAKLGTTNRTEAVRVGVQQGLISM